MHCCGSHDYTAVGAMKRSVTNLQSRKKKLQRNKSGVQAFFEAPYPQQKHNEEPGVVYTFKLKIDLKIE